MNNPAMTGHDASLEERMWVRPVPCNKLNDLLKNPASFVQEFAGKKLGNLQLNPIVTIGFQYPCAQAGQNEEPAGNVIVQGIADTNHINVRIVDTVPVSYEAPEPEVLTLFDPQHPLHILLQTPEQLAFAHFHFMGDTDASVLNAFSTARYPVRHFKRIQAHINDLLSAAKSGAGPIQVFDEDKKLVTVESVTIDPKMPCVFNCQFNMATMTVGGCNCAIGYYKYTNNNYWVYLNTVCCSTYLSVPL